MGKGGKTMKLTGESPVLILRPIPNPQPMGPYTRDVRTEMHPASVTIMERDKWAKVTLQWYDQDYPGDKVTAQKWSAEVSLPFEAISYTDNADEQWVGLLAIGDNGDRVLMETPVLLAWSKTWVTIKDNGKSTSVPITLDTASCKVVQIAADLAGVEYDNHYQ
jgi:hypothetical protein